MHSQLLSASCVLALAAYVRVSTSKDDQLNSFAAQYIHYKKLFEDSTYEELIDIYSDEGISGTTTDKRDGSAEILTTYHLITFKVDFQPVKRLMKVAAYCRVSTEADEQANSHEAQIAHYTEEIAKHPDWINAGIFSDKGITGTMAKTRP